MDIIERLREKADGLAENARGWPKEERYKIHREMDLREAAELRALADLVEAARRYRAIDPEETAMERERLGIRIDSALARLEGK